MSVFLPGSIGTGSEQATDALGPGFLTNVSAFTEDTNNQAGSIIVSCDVVRGGTSNAHRWIHLCTAYLTEHQPVSWNGLIEVDDECLLLWTVLGDLVPGVRCNHNLLTIQASGPIERYLRNAVGSRP